MKNSNDRNNRFAKIASAILLLAFILGFISGCAKDNSNGSPAQDDDTRYEQITEVCNTIDKLKNSEDYKNKDIEAQTGLVLKEVSTLAKNGKIKSDSIICDEKDHIITFEYSSGVLGCDIVGGFKEDCDSIGSSSGLFQYDQEYTYSGKGPKADAIILNAMTNRQEVDTKCKQLATTWQSFGISTKYDVSVTLDDLANLKGYEFVYFKMHGYYMVFSYHGEKRQPCVFLEKGRSRDNIAKYREDLNAHRIGFTTDGQCFITPSFMEAHYNKGDLSGNIWFFGCCQLMGANGSAVSTAWEKVLLNLSVSAFVGFYNTNYTDYNLALVRVFVNSLVKGENVRTSLENATKEYGSNDIKWLAKEYRMKPEESRAAAYPLLRGNANATLKWEDGSVQESSLTPEPSSPDTFTSATSSSASSSSASTTAAIGKATVSEAYKKSYNSGYGKFTARIPKITIAGVDTKKLNKEIYDYFKPKIASWRECNYSYYIGKTYISILIKLEEHHDESPATNYYVYNISRKTGKKLSRTQMLKELGIKESSFESRAKKAIKYFWKKSFLYPSKKAPSYVKKYYNTSISKASLKKVKPYVNSKGKLCYLYNQMSMPAGSGNYDVTGTC